jgi:hypothetical protein
MVLLPDPIPPNPTHWHLQPNQLSKQTHSARELINFKINKNKSQRNKVQSKDLYLLLPKNLKKDE